MPLSNKERFARYYAKINADPAAREKMLENRRQRYQQMKQAGHNNYIPISQLPASKAQDKRTQWAHNQRQHRKRLKQEEAVCNLTLQSVDSIEDLPCLDQPEQSQMSFQLHQTPSNMCLKSSDSSRNSTQQPSEEPSLSFEKPKCSSTPDVSVKEKKKKTRHDREKQKLREEIQELKKKLYKAKRRTAQLSKKMERIKKQEKKTKKDKKSSKKKIYGKRESVKEFLTRDENSRLLPGKKDTISLNKVKEQRRVLVKSLKELHKEYCQEAGKLSYRQFVRLRPFYVTEPKSRDRNTCACYDHENLTLLIEKMFQNGILGSKSMTDALSHIVCDLKNKKCMFRQCAKCCYNDIELAVPNNSETISWYQWTKERVSTEGKTYTHFVKKAFTGTWGDLLKIFNEKLDSLAKHHYIWIHQAEQCRFLKNTLQNDEAVVHMDFSENYACKMNVEVQAFHFGGSRQQATVHTCMVYTAENTKAYATISNSLRHDERAVWAHLKPVFDEVLSNKKIKTLHFMSDGPLTQYRNRKNFYLMSTLPFLRGIENITWNYSEKSHGKGAPDGVGGSVKRGADTFVLQGGDLQNPKDLFEFLKKSDSNVEFFWISEEDISLIDEAVPEELPVVKGTLAIHQVTASATTPGKISFRDVSCFCHRNGVVCECGEPCEFEMKVSSFSSKEDSDEDLAGKMVIVSYEGKPFVGQVLKVLGEEVEVSCMQQSGRRNNFVWPQVADVIFYFRSDLKARISEPEPLTSRSSRLSDEDWNRFLSV
ncbi:uncharacterized protein LOC127533326 [Acanthochromis polyacanthus]|uniref:uncharacterized protein LOC110972534 n=1 Tax=Acanthochromis polyacanthus TaxID=80966 RepID=UPI000B8FD3DA|nr:uncharacterized protein LOC110972534 [Acanthochromis polyacanthus]XP_051801952.1 uncharacterized protein LOC127533326 [Acanthochromis polyacanthus]